MVGFLSLISVEITDHVGIIITFDDPVSRKCQKLGDTLVGNLEGSRYGESAPLILLDADSGQNKLRDNLLYILGAEENVTFVTLCAFSYVANVLGYLFCVHVICFCIKEL